MEDSLSLIRQQFPILRQTVNGHPLAYLDTAATAQCPTTVLEAMCAFVQQHNAGVHRGLHPLAERATAAYEEARCAVRDAIGAAHSDEIIFTRGTTESINLVARTVGERYRVGDAVLLTELDHHSNIVPWMQLRERTGIELRWVGVDSEGRLRMEDVAAQCDDGRVRLVAVTGQSNVVGVRPDLASIVHIAHARGALVLVDAAQLIAHHPVHVQQLDIDFLAFSGHKVYGPTGIGVLWSRREILESLPPFCGGGMMVRQVTRAGYVPAESPQRFEAGTPPVQQAIGLATALRWLHKQQRADIAQRELALLRQLARDLHGVPGVRILGPVDANDAGGCLSIAVDDVHAHDVSALLGDEGICARAGNHCAQILHDRLGVTASTRFSVGLYTSPDDIIRVAPALARAIARFRR